MQFLKLGGSLITRKDQPRTHRPDALARLSAEILAAQPAMAGRGLLIGHGSGSFGHTTAHHHGTRTGVSTWEGWLGFLEVWRDARALNQIVCDSLLAAGLPVISLSPSAAGYTSAGRVTSYACQPVIDALRAGILPVLHGDVVFDERLGGTILSTEEVFIHLAAVLRPRRILLAGLEPGVWEDFPARTRLIREISPGSYPEVRASLGGSAATDVTGGMLQKVETMLRLVQALPGLQVLIFSGEEPGAVAAALRGENPGTLICSEEGI